MNLITPDGGLLFWMVLIFAIVLLILAKWGFPAITSAVEGRSKRIADSLKKAEELEKQAAEMEVERAQIMAATKKEQAKMLREASLARDKILFQAKADAAEQTAKMIANAQIQIEADRQAALADMRRQVALLSVEVAEKVLRGKLETTGEQGVLIDRMVSEAAANSKKTS